MVGVMWKTVSEDCNLACDYCYYSTCGGKPGPHIKRIDVNLLEKFMIEYMAASKGTASFAWQGGEPLLAGLDFFQQVVSLQAQYAPSHTMISNALQTNGTLINERWAAFFKQYNFLLGVSLDGPREIHNLRRVDGAGQGSFDRVMKGIRYLEQQKVDFNILTVIHKDNIHKVKELMEFYKHEQFKYIQFIPCMNFRSQQVDSAGVYEVTPEQYGEFLCEVFDYWYNDGNPEMSIRFFDNLLSVYVHREAELCSHRKLCPKTMILEQNGDAYPCDFYLHSDWKLGNIATHSYEQLLSSPVYDDFLKLKPKLPDPCKSCEWQSLCHGGCPRNRVWHENDNTVDVDYFCRSYKQIYAYAHDRMQQLGDSIRADLYQNGILASHKGKPPGRNDSCACGSGRKYKNCCMK